MRELDRVAIEEFGVDLLQMMENAGRSLADLVQNYLGPPRGKSVLVLCGKGNNGGGGLVCARHLAIRGIAVGVVITARPEDLREVPARQLAIIQETSIPVLIVRGGGEQGADFLEPASLIVDALLGYSLAGDPRGVYASLITAANDSGKRVISLDVPSGLESETGTVRSPCVRARATMALALPKRGTFSAEARWKVGQPYLSDLGIPKEAYAVAGIDVGELFQDWPLVAL